MFIFITSAWHLVSYKRVNVDYLKLQQSNGSFVQRKCLSGLCLVPEAKTYILKTAVARGKWLNHQRPNQSGLERMENKGNRCARPEGQI